jgi:hypothetical protein
MENKEIRRIIFESLLHKNITRVNYFNEQLEKSSIYPLIFAKCLLDEFKNIDEYVNSSSFKAWEIDSNTGEKKYFKNIILLSKETEGKMMGQIDFRNINEIAKPLIEFSKIILNNDAQNSKLPKQQKKTSYVWQIDPDKELPELYRLMVNKYKLIASETTIEQFTDIFTGQPIENVNPIKWHEDNASELLYFIIRLEQLHTIVHNLKRADYQKMTACFVKPDGKPFNVVWKSLKTNIKNGLSPDKQKDIDELVKNF